MSSNFNQWLGPKNETEVNNILRLRTFRAYIEVVDKEQIVDKIANCQPEFRDEITPDGEKIFDIIGFNLFSDFDNIPTCSISVPSGKVVANMFESPNINKIVKEKNQDFQWQAVKGIDTYPSANKAKLMEQGYRGVILWYQEAWKEMDIDQNTEHKGKFKQIFKGVITTDAFQRIAHRQENVTITATHWLQLFKTVSMNNLLLNVQAVHSTDTPWLYRMDGNYSKDADTGGGNGVPAHTQEAQWLRQMLNNMSSGNEDLDINEAVFNVMTEYCSLQRDYSPVYESFRHSGNEADGKALEEVIKKNHELIRDIIDKMRQAYKSGKQGKFSKPKLTSENVGRRNSPIVAFDTVVWDTGVGTTNGLTFYQFLTSVCTQLGLSLVCTANSVSCESLNPRPKQWARLGPPRDGASDNCISMATQITGSTPFSAEIVAAIAMSNYVPPFDERTGELTDVNAGNIKSSPKDAMNLSGNMWGYGKADPQLVDKNISFGTIAYVNLPRWYAVTYSNKEETRGETNQNKTLTPGQAAQEQTPAPATQDTADDKMLGDLALIELFKARTFGHHITVTMPININIMVGSPVLVMDSNYGYFHSGIIASFNHVLQQSSMMAQTTMQMIWTEPLFGEGEPDKDMSQSGWTPAKNAPKENKNGFEQNPLYKDSFDKRGIYE